MGVERLSQRGLRQILAGRVKELPLFVVIKFYSNTCHYCHELQEDFMKISEENEEAHFFAFNIDDHPSVQKVLNFKGVPTICTVALDQQRPRVRVMPEPTKPHKKKWYHVKDIKEFIDKEKNI